MRHARITWAAALLLALVVSAGAHAQLAGKPSAYIAQRRGQAMAPAPQGGPADLERVPDRAAFDSLARIHAPGTLQAVPHVLFVVDRSSPGRVYFLNTRRYPLHEDFLRARFLVAGLDHKTLAGFYRRPDRRFVLGTLGYRTELGRWLIEFWEGDLLTPELLALSLKQVGERFFAPVGFKANAAQQEAAAKQAGIEAVTEAQILGERAFMALNPGVATGRLRLVDDIEAENLGEDIAPTDIVVLREVPLTLAPVAGVIVAQPSTVLSHVNLLVKGWDVPNAYLKGAFETLQPLDGQWVTLKVADEGHGITPAAPAEIASALARARKPNAAVAAVRPPNLTQRALLPLGQLNATRADACGGKAARLGQVEAARRAGRLGGVAPVPDGFCIPFAAHREFMQREDVARRIAAAFATEGFERSRAVRRQALEALRRDLVELPLDDALSAPWRSAWSAQLGAAGVFVRSSSNSEDLPNFSGAGLYTTVPNVTREADLARAVKTVWASVFNAEAVEARRQAGIADAQVAMAVFVQRAVDSVSAGVMVTRDPFDATHQGVVYVSAKRGIGIKVVEGRRVAEQSMFESRSGAVRRLSRSQESAELKLDAAGGVSERPLEAAVAREVLSEAQVRSLARVGRQLAQLLGGAPQDIEWAIDPQGRIVVLQARPFVERKVL
ncbi:PEP/pyruvate-binding domain-containing protein [Ideonella sp. YS5]|uniref:PEP/pyruvate-binding domain-containing protein n=1 Tax=Ideonella sp. YS5 TaxID=3453714 RepID=UPI003EF06E70